MLKVLFLSVFVFSASTFAGQPEVTPLRPVDCSQPTNESVARVSTPSVAYGETSIQVKFLSWYGTCAESYVLNAPKVIFAGAWGRDASRHDIGYSFEIVTDKVIRVTLEVPYSEVQRIRESDYELRYRFVPNRGDRVNYDWLVNFVEADNGELAAVVY